MGEIREFAVVLTKDTGGVLFVGIALVLRREGGCFLGGGLLQPLVDFCKTAFFAQ